MCIKDVHGNIWSHAKKCCANVTFLSYTHNRRNVSDHQSRECRGPAKAKFMFDQIKKRKKGKIFKQNKVGFKKQISRHTTN